jgi:hypothetical protein
MVSNEGDVRRFFNTGYSNGQQKDSTIGLSNVTVKNDNGVLRCQFNRTKHIALEDGKYFSLYSTWYVLLAKGSLSGSECEDFAKLQSIFYFKFYSKLNSKNT